MDSRHFMPMYSNWSRIKLCNCDLLPSKLGTWAVGKCFMAELGLPEDPQLYCCEEVGVLGLLSRHLLLMYFNWSRIKLYKCDLLLSKLLI